MSRWSLAPVPGRQTQGPGTVGVLKVEDIAPIGRDRLGGGAGLQGLPDEGELAGPGGPQGEEVVAILPDTDPEVQGVLGAILGDEPRERLQFGSGRERGARRGRSADRARPVSAGRWTWGNERLAEKPVLRMPPFAATAKWSTTVENRS